MYQIHNGKAFLISELKPEVLAPFEKGKLFTQNISSVVCKIQDQFIVMKIEETLNTYDSVLVVYGGSHWSIQKNINGKLIRNTRVYSTFVISLKSTKKSKLKNN